jgi:hypothetical protein
MFHRKIGLIESNAKCPHLKKSLGKGLCGRYLSEAPSPPRFCLGVIHQGTKFGQIQSIKLLQNVISNTNPRSHTLSVYTVRCFDTEKGGTESREKGRGATEESTDHKAGSKMPT